MSRRFARERSIAIQAVERACQVCLSVQATVPPALQKQDRSPATVADFAAQAVVAATLAEVFPEETLIAEEDSAELRKGGQEQFRDRVIAEARAVLPALDAERTLEAIDRGKEAAPPQRQRWWVLDPLDGTKGFLRGEQYAVALALIEEGRVVLGVLGCPRLAQSGCLFVAVAGEGSRGRALDGGQEWPIRVDAVTDPSDALLCESVESEHSSHQVSAKIIARVGLRRAPLRMDSQCKYATVARGEASIYLRVPSPEYEEKVWDHAAGAIIVEEAGGLVTDLLGAPLDFSGGRILRPAHGLLATNGILHQRVLAAVTQAAANRGERRT